MISTESNLKSLPPDVDPINYDFDHPDSLDFDNMYSCLLEMYNCQETKTPVYDFELNAPLPNKWKILKPKPIIIFEGILSMYDERIRNLFDLKIFVNVDLDIALSRRIIRDIRDRGRDVKEVLHRFHRFVKQNYNAFVKDQMVHAHIIINGNNDNSSRLISCD